MIRSRLDFPAPLAPSTPILAPGKKARWIPLRISRDGGTTFRRSRIVKMYSPAIGGENRWTGAQAHRREGAGRRMRRGAGAQGRRGAGAQGRRGAGAQEK